MSSAERESYLKVKGLAGATVEGVFLLTADFTILIQKRWYCVQWYTVMDKEYEALSWSRNIWSDPSGDFFSFLKTIKQPSVKTFFLMCSFKSEVFEGILRKKGKTILISRLQEEMILSPAASKDMLLTIHMWIGNVPS